MKRNFIYKLLLTTLMLVLFVNISAQSSVSLSADSLISKMRYATAFEYLQTNDPNDTNPELVMQKIDLLMKFHINTDFYQRFGMRDMLPGQSINDMRLGNVTTAMIEYKPDSVLNKLIIQYPQEHKLNKALANYYYSVLTEYSENWFVPDSVLIGSIKEHYGLAHAHGEADYWSYFGLGYVYMLSEDVKEAIKNFELSIQLQPDFALSHYNLAAALYSDEQYAKALEHALKAYALHNDQDVEYIAETARLAAMIYEEQGNLDKAYEYYTKADKILPNDYSTLLPMMALTMKMKNPGYRKLSEELLALAPTNAAIYQDLLRVYSENELEKEFISFMEGLKNVYRPNLTVMANVHLHQAIAQYDMDEWVAAKINFEKARSLFRNLFNPSHKVFSVIDSYTDAIKKKKK